MNAQSPLRPILPARAILPARPILPAQPIRPTRASRGSGVIQGAFLGGKPRVTMMAGRSGSATVQRSAAIPTANAIPTSNATPLPPEFGGFRPVMPAQRMPEAIQRKMETLFKTSFSDVRIHVGPDAGLIGASAFTQGSDVFFAPGQYNPNTPGGQRLLGQQLAHVVQQRSGRARNPFGSGVAVVNDPMLKAEAEMMGTRAAMPQAVQTKAPGQRQDRTECSHGFVTPDSGPDSAEKGRACCDSGQRLIVGQRWSHPAVRARSDFAETHRRRGDANSTRSVDPFWCRPRGRFFRVNRSKPSWPRHPSCRVVRLQSRASPVVAVQPMMAIGAAVAVGHQLVNSVVTQVGRRVLGI